MARTVNRVSAIIDIINEFKSRRSSPTACNRLIRASTDLGCTADEVKRVAEYAGYWRPDTATPFPGYEDCKWPK